MRSICFGVAILIGSVVGAYAQSDVSRVEVHGPGGAPFDDPCHGSDVLIGFNYTAGTAINTVAGVCQSQKNGSWTDKPNYGLNTWGKQATGDDATQGAPRCPSQMAIGQMTVTLDKNNEVQAIQAICVGMAVRNLDHTIITANGHGTGVTSKHIECTPPNDLAHGLIGHYGALVDGVGLECATFNFPK